jgi:hypothetical protein
MAKLYESLFGFGIFGIITIVVLIFVILVIMVRNAKTVTKFISMPFIILLNFFLNFFKNNGPMIGADNCAVIPGTGMKVTRVPSTYLAHVAFFFSFLFTNAYYIYNIPKDTSSSDELYENRRNRSAMIMTTLISLYIIIVLVRYNITGCESYYGITLTTAVFSALGFGAYKLAELCGARNSDVLGITVSFIPSSAKKPVACAAR